MAYPWWEIVSLLKKLFLMGFINVLADMGTTAQLSVAFLASNVFLVLHLLLKPWRNGASHVLETVASFGLVCLFFGSILLSIGNFADTIGTTADGQALPERYFRAAYISYGALSSFFFLISVSAIACAVAQLIWRPVLKRVGQAATALGRFVAPKHEAEHGKAERTAGEGKGGASRVAAGGEGVASRVGLVAHWLEAALLVPSDLEKPINLFKMSSENYLSYRSQIVQLVLQEPGDGLTAEAPAESASSMCDDGGVSELSAVSEERDSRGFSKMHEEGEAHQRVRGKRRSVFDGELTEEMHSKERPQSTRSRRLHGSSAHSSAPPPSAAPSQSPVSGMLRRASELPMPGVLQRASHFFAPPQRVRGQRRSVFDGESTEEMHSKERPSSSRPRHSHERGAHSDGPAAPASSLAPTAGVLQRASGFMAQPQRMCGQRRSVFDGETEAERYSKERPRSGRIRRHGGGGYADAQAEQSQLPTPSHLPMPSAVPQTSDARQHSRTSRERRSVFDGETEAEIYSKERPRSGRIHRHGGGAHPQANTSTSHPLQLPMSNTMQRASVMLSSTAGRFSERAKQQVGHSFRLFGAAPNRPPHRGERDAEREELRDGESTAELHSKEKPRSSRPTHRQQFAAATSTTPPVAPGAKRAIYL